MTDRPRAWMDCETTGLHPDRRAYEIGLILRRLGRPDDELAWFVDIEDLDLANAHPIALEVGRFWQRHPQAHLVPLVGNLADVTPDLPDVPPDEPVFREVEVLKIVGELTVGAYIMGSNPAFDMNTLAPRMAVYGIKPDWYYRPVDVPERAAGWLTGAGLPVPTNGKGDEKSDLIARACGVDPADYARHEALGDCRLFRDLFDAIQCAPMRGDVPTLTMTDMPTYTVDEVFPKTLADIAGTADRARAAFDAAARLAPRPDSRDADPDAWTRHYAALGLAAHSAFRDALASVPPNPVPGSRPDLGYLTAIATSATAAAIALTTHPDEVAGELWDLSPEAGALNGEYLDWLAESLDLLGVNPADLYRWYEAADFTSASVAAVKS